MSKWDKILVTKIWRVFKIEKIYDILNKFYNKLYDQFLMENKIKNDSLLFSLLEVKSNVRFRAIRSSSISEDKLDTIILNELLTANFIKCSDESQKYVITALGIWEIERELKGYTVESILAFLDKKYLDFEETSKNLTDKERVILFSMFCARTFSENSTIDLKKNEFILNAWERIIENCKDELYKLKIIKKINKEELFGKKGNEHIVSHLIRHTDSLPKKVGGIYRAPGKQKYFLALYKENSLQMDSLESLIGLIFNSKDKIPIEEINEIFKFANEIAYTEAPHIFDSDSHIFASTEFDDKIKNAIRRALLLN